MNRTTRVMILSLAERNSIVKKCLGDWHTGEISFEQAMMNCVTYLVGEQEGMKERVLKELLDKINTTK